MHSFHCRLATICTQNKRKTGTNKIPIICLKKGFTGQQIDQLTEVPSKKIGWRERERERESGKERKREKESSEWLANAKYVLNNQLHLICSVHLMKSLGSLTRSAGKTYFINAYICANWLKFDLYGIKVAKYHRSLKPPH